MKLVLVLISLVLTLGLGMAGPAQAKGSVVKYVEPKSAVNPPPAVMLNSFQHFELRPIAMDAPYESQKINQTALERLQANLDLNANPVIAEWNAKAAAGGRTLRIEPTVRHIRFVSGGARFWAGAAAGGSAVLVTVKISDAETGEVIAEPEFYQHSKGIAGAWTFGAADGAMLIRVSVMVTNYLRDNYAALAGGSTSVSPEPRA
jgi:hypothetical protein